MWITAAQYNYRRPAAAAIWEQIVKVLSTAAQYNYRRPAAAAIWEQIVKVLSNAAQHHSLQTHSTRPFLPGDVLQLSAI